MKKYDLLVIGAGPGGYVAAIRSAQLGLKTACVEKRKALGGACLNVGCIPSKALLYSSQMYHQMQKESSRHGIVCNPIHLDFAKMMQRKEEVVAGFVKGIDGLFRKNKVERLEGNAQFIGPHQVKVGEEIVEAGSILLATGSEPIALPFLPFDEKVVLSSTGALALQEIPKKLLIVGAGVIGVELGSVYRRLGSEVEYVEFSDRICPALDQTLSKGLEKAMSAQGMRFHLQYKVIQAEMKNGVVLTLQGPNGEEKLSGDKVLVAVGRRPYSEGLGLEKVGIEKDSKGYVKIDGCFRTSQPHIFAIGDLVEGPMLAHKASEEGIAVAEWIAGGSSCVDYFSIPNVAYTDPEAAAVGLTEEEVKARGLAYRSSLFSLKANSRARCIGEEEGFVKLIAEEKSHKLLGMHILASHASEMIAVGALALAQRLSVEELADVCFAHPTLSEAIKEASLALFKQPIHA